MLVIGCVICGHVREGFDGGRFLMRLDLLGRKMNSCSVRAASGSGLMSLVESIGVACSF